MTARVGQGGTQKSAIAPISAVDKFLTAQGDMQSTNQEIAKLNDELQIRNFELNRLTDDLDNMLQGVEIPFLIVGPDLHIRRFTPQIERIVSIKPEDVGRLITDFAFNVDVPDFKGAVEQVLRTLEPSDSEVRAADGHWYSLRIRPYRTSQGSVDGAVVAFIDIDLMKHAVQFADAAREHAEALVRTVREPLITLDSSLIALEANQAFYEAFGVSEEETIGSHLYELGNSQWDIPELRFLLEEVLPGGGDFANLEVEHVFPRIGRRIMVLNARRVREESGLPSILLAIEDATLVRRQARFGAALNEINLKIGSTFELEDVLDDVLALSVAAVSAESGLILLKQEGIWLVKGAHDLSTVAVGQILGDEEVPLSLFSADRGDPVLVPDISADVRFASSVLAQEGFASALLVPLVLREETIGSVAFRRSEPGDVFDSIDTDLAKRLGIVLSLAVDNAQLYATQRQIANTLQTALLTPARDIDGIDFGSLYQSATAAARVGGDLYDLFELSGSCVGILIGDVSGKGVEAATLAGLVKNTIRAIAAEHESPADVISRTNDIVFKATASSVFVTLVFGVLDRASGRLVYCSAGHTRGIVRRSDGQVDLLEVQSSLAGAFPRGEFVNGEVSIPRGDVLILYTDGVTEARRDSKMLGEGGLVGMVKGMGEVTAADIPESIFAAVHEFAGGRLVDDIAIIAVGLS